MRTFIPAAAALCTMAVAVPAAAQSPTGFQPCHEHWAGSIGAVSPGENMEGIRQFYNGRVTLYRLDTEEPAAASFGVAVVMPSGDGVDEPAYFQCLVNWGFGFLDFEAIESSYDPARGLTIAIPTRSYVPESGGMRVTEPLRLLLNVADGSIVDLDAPAQ